MSKELRKELEAKAKEFKHQPDDVKKRGRDLYKVAIKALDKCDYLQSLLDAYKAPTLYQKTESHLPPARTYLSRAERITEFLQRDPEGEQFKQFLRWNHLSLEEAKEIVERAKEIK